MIGIAIPHLKLVNIGNKCYHTIEVTTVWFQPFHSQFSTNELTGEKERELHSEERIH